MFPPAKIPYLLPHVPTQGKVVPTTADEGVAVFEFIEEVGYEAIFRGALPGAIVSFVSASVTFVTLSAGISKAIAPGL